MSALVHDLVQQMTRSTGDWLPGAFLLVVLVTTLLLLLHREVTRGMLPADRARRVRSTAVVVVPMAVCVAVAVGARFLEWAT